MDSIKTIYNEKKEFAVGEVFQFGLKKLKVVEDENDFKSACKDCYMQEMCHNFLVSNINIAIGPCEDFRRSDGKSVHFVKVEEEE